MGLREILFLPMVAGICIGSLIKPKLALYGYLWFALMRPDILAFADGKYPVSMILAGFTFLAALRSLSGAGRAFRNGTVIGLLILQVFLLLSFVFAVNPDLSADRYFSYIKMIAVLFCIPAMVQTEQDLHRVLLVMILSLGAIAIKFGSNGVLHGGVVLANGFGDVMDDNNFLALAMAMLVALCWGYLGLARSRLLKLALCAISMGAIAQIVMSNSRGGSLALGVVILLILRRSKRRIASLAVLAISVGGLIYMVRDTYFDRMSTLRAPGEEPSAASRLVHGATAIEMWKDYPILGVGFGGLNYGKLAPRYTPELDDHHVAHNTYLQMGVDSGVFAFCLYLWVLIRTTRRMGRLGRRLRDPARATLARGMQAALLAFMIGGTFYSCHRMDFPYMVLLCAACYENIASRLEEEGEPELEAGEAEPVETVS